jgi:hypothetical protein
MSVRVALSTFEMLLVMFRSYLWKLMATLVLTPISGNFSLDLMVASLGTDLLEPNCLAC